MLEIIVNMWYIEITDKQEGKRCGVSPTALCKCGKLSFPLVGDCPSGRPARAETFRHLRADGTPG